MNIRELEQLTGITKQNIRFYEKKGLLQPRRNRVNNYREYTKEDIQTLKTIKLFRKLDLSLEEIHAILSEEAPLHTTLERHIEMLRKKQQELSACIDVCTDLLGTELRTLDVEGTLDKMNTIEKNGGKFMSILRDYKRFSAAEQVKRFHFTPDTMVMNPTEFTEALLAYAEENHLNLHMIKESMYPVFEIDGLEYTAYRSFRRWDAVITCTLTHPEEAGAKDISSGRRRIYRLVRSSYPFWLGLLLIVIMAVSRRSVESALLVAVMLFPYLCWVFIRGK